MSLIFMYFTDVDKIGLKNLILVIFYFQLLTQLLNKYLISPDFHRIVVALLLKMKVLVFVVLFRFLVFVELFVGFRELFL